MEPKWKNERRHLQKRCYEQISSAGPKDLRRVVEKELLEQLWGEGGFGGRTSEGGIGVGEEPCCRRGAHRVPGERNRFARLLDHGTGAPTGKRQGFLVGARQLVRQDGGARGQFYRAQPLQPAQTRAPIGER